MTAAPSLTDALPSHWQLKRLKFIARVQTGMAKGKDHADADTIEVPYLRVANVQDGYLALDDVATMAVPVADLERYRLQPGDVLMNEGGDFDKLGRGHVWHGQIDPCIHQNHVFAVRPHGVSPEWLNAWTGSAPAQFYFMGRAKQSTNLASISSSNVMELPVPVPPPEEQVARLAFIDRQTARIDALIAKKTRFIALLREKRQALITQAVTRGLDPDVEMKDSGVEWLGRVPAHWRVVPLGYVATVESGSTPDRSNAAFWGGDIPWIKTGEVNYKPITAAEEFISEEALKATSLHVSQPGTLLMAMYGQGTTRGRVAVLEIAATYNQACAAIRFNTEVSAKFAQYFFIAVYEFVRDDGNETSQMNLSAQIIRRIKVVVPSGDEQRKIVARLDDTSMKLDKLIARSEGSIALLKEHRSALITATVTGQIDIDNQAT